MYGCFLEDVPTKTANFTVLYCNYERERTMKKKRIAAVFLLIASIVTLFSGCSRTEKASKGDVTTITMWTPNTHNKAEMEEAVDEFNNTIGKEQGIYFEYVVKEGEMYKQSIELALQSGQGPDLISDYGKGLRTMIESGYVAAISDLPGGEEFVAQYADSIREYSHRVNGKVYRVPVSVTTAGLLYNKDMFKAAGIVDENGEAKPPVTFDEMREVSKKLTNRSKQQFGIILPAKWSGWVGSDMTQLMQSSCGHEGFDPVTGEYDFSILEPIIECYMGIIDDGSAYPGMDGIDNDMARAYFAEGNIGMKIGMSFDVGVLNDQFPAEMDWGVAPLPVVDAGKRYKQRCSYGSSPLISKNAFENIDGEKLMTVLKLVVGDKENPEIIRKMYKTGKSIPVDWDIVKDIELKNAKTGWKEFAQMVEISVPPVLPGFSLEGKKTLQERIITEALPKKKSVKTVLDEYTKDATEATKAYYELHTDIDFNTYLDKDWYEKVKLD